MHPLNLVNLDETSPTSPPIELTRAAPMQVTVGAGERYAYDELALRACIERVGVRDQAAFAELYDATVGCVNGLALRMLRDSHAAEEIVSDVYLQAWQKAADFDSARGSVRTWLLVMCRSRALDALRARASQRSGEAPEFTEAADENCDPLDILTATRRETRVHSCLVELAPIQRQLIALAFFRGSSHSEIAASTGMPLGSVKTHIRKALERLRALLGDAGEVDHGR